MIEDISRIEERQTNAVAQEYIGKGYEVDRDVLLDFFPDFRADLVAKKADEEKSHRSEDSVFTEKGSQDTQAAECGALQTGVGFCAGSGWRT